MRPGRIIGTRNEGWRNNEWLRRSLVGFSVRWSVLHVRQAIAPIQLLPVEIRLCHLPNLDLIRE
ncbi:hypothetical protein [Pleurocapsa sp. CCALA 161]|uniref:hypothetical protein n=1 Tax=Pleurocapsa sp. CCALA 161 TaxID=2107688 RepID=UPI0011B223DC|nr:hypothetical protein [Pleurocapsa sp. CCALA 161]